MRTESDTRPATATGAFLRARVAFPLMHVDTGENFPETIEFRDRRVNALGERLLVASVQDSIDQGRVTEEQGPRASRNRLQTTTLLDAIAEHRFDAAIGGARRDEERARAKERMFLSLIHISEPTRQAEISYAVF